MKTRLLYWSLPWLHVNERLAFLSGLYLAPCKGIRNPESQIFLPLESGFWGFGIQNPVPGIRNPTRGIRNPTSSISTESRSGMYHTVSSNHITNHNLLLSFNVPYHHHHQKVFGHLTCTSIMLLLRLGGFWFLTGHMIYMFNIILLSCLSELFRPWPTLSPDRSTPFTVVFFHAGYMYGYPTLTVLFWCFDNLLNKDGNTERST